MRKMTNKMTIEPMAFLKFGFTTRGKFPNFWRIFRSNPSHELTIASIKLILYKNADLSPFSVFLFPSREKC